MIGSLDYDDEIKNTNQIFITSLVALVLRLC